MLSRRDRVVLDTLLPSGAHAELSLGIFDAGMDDVYAEMTRHGFSMFLLGFRLSLLAGAWLAPLLIGRLPPIDRLSRVDRERALEALGKSRHYAVRQMALLLKANACMCYGGNRAVRDAVGFPRHVDDPRARQEDAT